MAKKHSKASEAAQQLKDLATVFVSIIVLGFILLLFGAALTITLEQPDIIPWLPPVGPSTIDIVKDTTYIQSAFDPLSEITAKQFTSEEEYSAFMKSYEGGGYGDYYSVRGGMDMGIMPTMAFAEAAPSGQKATDYSTTNVQVEGVDEADLIKTDGEYIYTISGATTYIIKAYPGADAETLSTIKNDKDPDDLFIYGDTLAVIGDYRGSLEGIGFVPSSGMVFFDIYDVSDRSNPKMVKEYLFEGSYSDARLYGDYAYLVVMDSIDYRPVYPMPLVVEDGVVGEMAIDDMYYYPIPYDWPELVTVHSISLKDIGGVESKAVAVEGGHTLYMSTESVYLAYTEDVNEYDLRRDIAMGLLESKLTSYDKSLIKTIKEMPGDILSPREKEEKVYQVYAKYIDYMTKADQDKLEDEIDDALDKKLEEYKYFEFTVVHELPVKNGDIEIGQTGKVPGHVINQFSMDEYDKVLRIATTISPRWSWAWKDRSESVNNVYALDAGMAIIGKLEGLAEGEQIYSTRFMGKKLYMVTFEQIDPFFVIDLSDPTNIKSLGELKITGFSKYLHPYDETTIIGLGNEATEQGRVTGLKISLFDVSDVANPTEIAKFVTDEKYAQTTADYEHKAFLFSKEKELLVIPAYNQEYRYWDDSGGEEQEYNGALVFKISKEEIVLRGLIDHSGYGENSWGPAVQRSLYIEELLYTKSEKLLRINELSDLSSVKEVKLSTSSPIPVY